MKKFIASVATLTLLTVVSVSANAQLKKDGSPDMRYKANKEMYGNTYSTPSYSTPTYSQPVYSSPTYTEPKSERNYQNGGSLKVQNGYMKSNGTYVAPHLKTKADNKTYNNLSSWP